MKQSLKSLTALAVLGLAALPASAQPAVKIAVVDMAKLYDTHYKTVEQNAKIQADDQKAQEEVERMNKEGNVLVEEYKNLSEQANSPALSPEAKSKAQNEAQKKLEQIQNKQREVQSFIQNTRNSLSQRLNTFRGLMLAKVATELAKKRGANLLLDKAGPTAIGISNILYSDAAYDLTDEVAKEVNKDKPAGAPSAPSAPTAPAAAGAAPAVSVPGLSPKK